MDPSSEVSTAFTLLEVDENSGKLLQSALSSQILDIMVEGRLQFVVEDRFRPSREQGYWCRLEELGMQAHQVIVTTTPSIDFFIPVNLYHLVFGV